MSLALAPDPFASRGDSFGSYLAFRKLRQDVQGFQSKIKELAANFMNGNEALADAMVMGRFKDGTPLALYGEATGGNWTNNFDYSGDHLGSRCPLHSHVRRANPRTAEARAHRIVRRGIPYQEESGEQGLLFLCFQSRIHDQFAYIHRKWANVDFPFAGTGIDPLIGRPGFQQSPDQQWQTGWGEKPNGWFDFSGVITCRGGEFFFAPSLPFLQGL